MSLKNIVDDNTFFSLTNKIDYSIPSTYVSFMGVKYLNCCTPVGSGAIEVVGSGDYITFYTGLGEMSSGDFSIGTYFKNNEDYGYLWSCENPWSMDNYSSFILRIVNPSGEINTKKMLLEISQYDQTGSTYYYSDSGVFPDNDWHHIEVSRSGDNIIFYYDGNFYGKDFCNQIITADKIYLGTNIDSDGIISDDLTASGLFKDFYITKDEILNYDNFNPEDLHQEINSFYQVYYPFSFNNNDKSNYRIFFNRGILLDNIDDYSDSGCYYANANDSYINIPTGDYYSYESGSYTAEFDLYVESDSVSGTQSILNTSTYNNHAIRYNDTDGVHYIVKNPDGGTYKISDSGNYGYCGKWNKISVIKNNKTYKLYKNEVLIDSLEVSQLGNVLPFNSIFKGHDLGSTTASDLQIGNVVLSKIDRSNNYYNGPISTPVFSYGISQTPETRIGANFNSIITKCRLNPIYAGQYVESDPDKIYGKAYIGDDSLYHIDFYADSGKVYPTLRYSSENPSETDIEIIGSGYGFGLSGVMSYDFGRL